MLPIATGQSLSRTGEGDYRIEAGNSAVMKMLAEGLDIRTNWPVVAVDWRRKDVIVLHSQNGEVLTCNRLIITVPIRILQDRVIKFVPPLPRWKISSIKAIDMTAAIKVVVVVSRVFWPESMHGVICSRCPFPEIWFDKPDRVGEPYQPELYDEARVAEVAQPSGGHPDEFVCSGFVCADFAVRLAALGSDETIARVLLDQVGGWVSGWVAGWLGSWVAGWACKTL